jgi:hypothetical protein
MPGRCNRAHGQVPEKSVREMAMDGTAGWGLPHFATLAAAFFLAASLSNDASPPPAPSPWTLSSPRALFSFQRKAFSCSALAFNLLLTLSTCDASLAPQDPLPRPPPPPAPSVVFEIPCSRPRVTLTRLPGKAPVLLILDRDDVPSCRVGEAAVAARLPAASLALLAAPRAADSCSARCFDTSRERRLSLQRIVFFSFSYSDTPAAASSRSIRASS